jgi:hypothetical protein
LPPLPPPPGPPPGPPSVSPPLEPRISQVNGFALNFQETENNNSDTRNNNTRNNNGIYGANSTAYQNNEIVRDSLILYNETNNRQKLADFPNRDINDRAEEVLRHIKSHREELNENLTKSLQNGSERLFYERNTPIEVYFKRLNSLIARSPVHTVFKYIAKKILFVKCIDQVCTPGLKLDALNHPVLDKNLLDPSIVKELLETVELMLYGLLRMSGFSVLTDSIREFNDPNSPKVRQIISSMGFPEGTSIHLVPVTIMILMVRLISTFEISMSPEVSSIEDVLLGRDIDQIWKKKFKVTKEDDLIVSLVKHTEYWKQISSARIDLIAALSWARYFSERFTKSNRVEFIYIL